MKSTNRDTHVRSSRTHQVWVGGFLVLGAAGLGQAWSHARARTNTYATWQWSTSGADSPRHTLAQEAFQRAERAFLVDSERDHREVLSRATWEGFYAGLQQLDAGDAISRHLLIRRLSDQFEWSQETCTALARLLDEEQRAFTVAAVEQYGVDVLYKALDLSKATRIEFMQQLASEREGFRRRFDARFGTILDGPALAALNEHLRSGSITLTRDTGDRSISVSGVGATRSSDV